MRVIYSIGARVGGGGIGDTAYHAVRGLYSRDMLHRLLCGSSRVTEIPAPRTRTMGLSSRALRKLAAYGPTRWLNQVHDRLYDRWAARHIDAADAFVGWENFCLRSLSRARALGAVTVVERTSPHPQFQHRLLAEEYRRWGRSLRIPRAVFQRAAEEIERADRVLVPSDFVRESFGPEGLHKLIQIPYGVDTKRLRPGPRPDEPFRVLFVGQVGFRKGVPYVLEAWKRLRWTDAELWITGRAIPEIKALLAAHRTLPGLCLTGHLADPLAAYQASHVFTLPSLA